MEPALTSQFQQDLALAVEHLNAGRPRQADQICRQILSQNANQPDALHVLGNVAFHVGQLEAAAELIGKAAKIRPSAVYLADLGLIFSTMKKPDEAITAYRQALALDPRRADVLNLLGNELKYVGRIDEAIARCRQAIQMEPNNPLLHSSLCYKIHFDPAHDAKMIAQELSIWNDRHGKPLASKIKRHENDPSPDRRLRIGYVSPDFYGQAESFFVLPLLQQHDRENFEIHCYASVRRPDVVTGWLKKAAHIWHDVLDMPDILLAEKIRSDGIDILVDLTMHMAFNRLPLFARKPAPIQVTWLAYPGGTGLNAMDYRLTDAHIDPPELFEEVYTEQSIRLPDSWCCYHPLGEESPAKKRADGPIRFGSLNNPSKINSSTLRLWSGLLQAITDSQMVMLVASEEQRNRICKMFEQSEINPSRIHFVTHQRRGPYLRYYDQIDIALDPLPYNGITTTCDALWMGVPVITLKGNTAAGRAGASLLSTVGLKEFIASTPDDFLKIGSQLAGDLPQLADLRIHLRTQMEASPLMDAARFAGNMESAYRRMWHQWLR